MRIIAIGHGEGKTTALVEYMLHPGNEDVTYIAPTRAQCEEAMRIARSLAGPDAHISPSRFVSANSLRGFGSHGRRQRFVVDELDAVLWTFLGGEVNLGALTPSDLEASKEAETALREVHSLRESLNAALDRLSATRFPRRFAQDRFQPAVAA